MTGIESYIVMIAATIRTLEAVLKLILPLLSDALLPCHSERSAAESKERGTTATAVHLLPTQVEKMLRLRSA